LNPPAAPCKAPSVAARVGLLAGSVLLLLLALWAGLERIGLALPPPHLAGLHGPLMVAAFFGALIALERAVGLGEAWTFLAPLLMVLGGLLAAAGVGFGLLVLLVGALFYLAVAGYIYRLQPADFTLTMGLGAGLLFLGDLAWLAARPAWAALLWAGYLVLVVTGERLELSRFLPRPKRAGAVFAVSEGIALLGLLAYPLAPALSRVAGLGFSLLAVWLLRHDVAWVNLRREGVHRFMGASLLSGYFWLLAGGLLLIVLGLPPAGPVYDAVLHGVFLGFVFPMVFGHAPVIFPAVLRLSIRFHPLYHLPLLLLHLSLLVRIYADLAGALALRPGAGLGNALAVLLYFAIAGPVSLRARRRGT